MVVAALLVMAAAKGGSVSGHQIGAATAALVAAGNLRTPQGNNIEAFSIAGPTGVLAAILAPSIGRARVSSA